MDKVANAKELRNFGISLIIHGRGLSSIIQGARPKSESLKPREEN